MARPPFIPGFDYRGTFAYSITCCTHDRAPWFSDPAAVTIAIAELTRAAAGASFDVLAWCAMPDHLHLLVQGTSTDATLRPFIKCWRQRSAHAFLRVKRQRLWQIGYWERVVRSTEDLQQVAGYIVANPVRAGLARSVDDWPHVGGRLIDGRGEGDGDGDGATKVAPS